MRKSVKQAVQNPAFAKKAVVPPAGEYVSDSRTITSPGGVVQSGSYVKKR